MTYDTRIITELKEAINRTENMVPFMRQDMIQLLEDAKYEIETLKDKLKMMQEERDEARREVCEFELVNMKQAYEYATHRGWDCYKEKTQ